jgi:hypothetical protein
LIVAKDVRALVNCLDGWLRSSEERDRAGAAGREIVRQNRGVAAEITRIVDNMIAQTELSLDTNKVDEV